MRTRVLTALLLAGASVLLAATPAGASPTPDAPESADAEAKPVAANGAEPIPSDVPEAEIVSEDAA